MAKKKAAPGTEDPTTTPRPRTRRATSRKPASPAGEPVDLSAITRPDGPHTASDRSTGSSAAGAARVPSDEEIAVAAYHRFLQRGGSDGRDFDDWIEAEQELRQAHHRSGR